MTVSPTPHPDGRDWSLQARLLRAELAGDEREWRRLLALNRQDGGAFEVMPTAFAMLLHRRFGGVTDRREITRFVSRYNAIAPSAHRVPPREAEAVLRAGLGETHLAELVDDATMYRVVYALLFMLVDDLALSEEEVDSLVTAADRATRIIADSLGPTAPEPLTNLTMIAGDDEMRWRPPRHVDGAAADTTSRRVDSDGPGAKKRRRAQRAGRVAGQPLTLMGRFLRASMLRQKEESDRLAERFPEFSSLPSLHVMIASFDIAVRRLFTPAADLAEISNFVVAMREAFGPDLPSLETEALIRHILGDDVEIDDIPPSIRTQAMVFVLMAAADYLERDTDKVDAIVSEAENGVFGRGFKPELA